MNPCFSRSAAVDAELQKQKWGKVSHRCFCMKTISSAGHTLTEGTE